MKSALVATAASTEAASIHKGLGGVYRVDLSHDFETCQGRFVRRRYDLTFIDSGYYRRQPGLWAGTTGRAMSGS